MARGVSKGREALRRALVYAPAGPSASLHGCGISFDYRLSCLGADLILKGRSCFAEGCNIKQP